MRKATKNKRAENSRFLLKINHDKNEIPIIEKVKEVITFTLRGTSWDSSRIPTTRHSHSQAEKSVGEDAGKMELCA